MNKEGNDKKQSIISRIISFLFLAILTVIACFLIFYIACSMIAKKSGKRPLVSLFTIVSPSMEPNIKVYDIVFETRVNKESELHVGDVITFYSSSIDTGGYTVTHRIKEIINDKGVTKYITKGDNNVVADDGMITFKDIVGKVHTIVPKLGYVQYFLSSTFGWLLVILIPTLGIVIGDVMKLKRIFSIKKQIEEIPMMKEIEEVREQEENKRIRAALEKADKYSKKK